MPWESDNPYRPDPERDDQYRDRQWIVSATWHHDGSNDKVSTTVTAPSAASARVRGMSELRSRYVNGSLTYAHTTEV